MRVAGTFIASPSKGGPKGGPNGSLAVGCSSNTCGNATAATATTEPTCADGTPSVGGFSDGKLYCCPVGSCVSLGQSSNSGSTPGLVVPVCLQGSASTVELCRRENDNLLPTIQFFRGRQARAEFQYETPTGRKPLSMADIITAGAKAAVKQCSFSKVVIPYTVGRPDAAVADDGQLPSPTSVIEDRHNSIFQAMGLNKIDMVTLVTGSHSIGGFRVSASAGETGCPYVPFDCSPASQIASPPFDNNVFKVACDGVKGVSTGACAWNTKCSNTAAAEPDCPLADNVRAAYAACNPSSSAYPTPGLSSDKFLCSQPSTRQRMVQYAKDEAFFFAKYSELFTKMADLGYADGTLTPL